jgi:hypothetical protein
VSAEDGAGGPAEDQDSGEEQRHDEGDARYLAGHAKSRVHTRSIQPWRMAGKPPKQIGAMNASPSAQATFLGKVNRSGPPPLPADRAAGPWCRDLGHYVARVVRS